MHVNVFEWIFPETSITLPPKLLNCSEGEIFSRKYGNSIVGVSITKFKLNERSLIEKWLAYTDFHDSWISLRALWSIPFNIKQCCFLFKPLQIDWPCGSNWWNFWLTLNISQWVIVSKALISTNLCVFCRKGRKMSWNKCSIGSFAPTREFWRRMGKDTLSVMRWVCRPFYNSFGKFEI